MPPTLALAVDELVRERYGSNRALAEHISVSEATIQRIRHGHIPSLTTLRKLAERTRFNLVELQRMCGMPVDPPVMNGSARNELENGIIEAVMQLTPERQRFLQDLIDTMLAAQDKEANHEVE